MTGDIRDRALSVVRWIARGAAGLSAVLILLIFIGEGLDEGFDPLLHLTVRESLMMAAFVAVWLGLVLGWKWQLTGGSLIIGGMVAFYLFDYLFSGTFPGGPYFLILASPAVLYLYCGFAETHLR